MDKKGQLREAFNLRLDELQVVDIAFLFACQTRPTIAVLYQDQKETRHVKTYEICVKTKVRPWGFHQIPPPCFPVVRP
jgi:DNA damage-binding protein 1